MFGAGDGGPKGEEMGVGGPTCVGLDGCLMRHLEKWY